MELVILNGHQTGLLSETDFFNNISSFPCQGTDTNKTEFVAYIHPWKSMTALHREYVIFAHISMRAAPSSRPRYSELTAPAEWDQLFFCFHCLFHRWFGGLISLQISFISGCVFSPGLSVKSSSHLFSSEFHQWGFVMVWTVFDIKLGSKFPSL